MSGSAAAADPPVTVNLGPNQFALGAGLENSCTSFAFAFAVAVVHVRKLPTSASQWEQLAEVVRDMARASHARVRASGDLMKYGLPTAETVREALLTALSGSPSFHGMATNSCIFLYVDDVAARAVSNGLLHCVPDAVKERAAVRKGNDLVRDLYGASNIIDHVRAAVQVSAVDSLYSGLPGACGLVMTKGNASHAAVVQCDAAPGRRWKFRFHLFDSHGSLSTGGTSVATSVDTVVVDGLTHGLMQTFEVNDVTQLYPLCKFWERCHERFQRIVIDFSTWIKQLLGYTDAASLASTWPVVKETDVASRYHVIHYVVHRRNEEACKLLKAVVEDDHPHNK